MPISILYIQTSQQTVTLLILNQFPFSVSGHLTTMSDVYSFGVVLLELLTGKRSVDKNRPLREQDLVEWARPLLKDTHKLERIMDPRLEGQYSIEGARKVAALVHQCVSNQAKTRPTMRTVVKSLEPIMHLTDIPVGYFVYVAPNEEENGVSVQRKEKAEEEKEKERQRKRKIRRRKRRVKPLRTRAVYSDTTLYKTLGTSLYTFSFKQTSEGIDGDNSIILV